MIKKEKEIGNWKRGRLKCWEGKRVKKEGRNGGEEEEKCGQTKGKKKRN